MASIEPVSKLTDYFGPLCDRLMCSTWPGYCARCQLWNCRDQAEKFGEPRQLPKPSADYLCAGDVGDSGWGEW